MVHKLGGRHHGHSKKVMWQAYEYPFPSESDVKNVSASIFSHSQSCKSKAWHCGMARHALVNGASQRPRRALCSQFHQSAGWPAVCHASSCQTELWCNSFSPNCRQHLCLNSSSSPLVRIWVWLHFPLIKITYIGREFALVTVVQSSHRSSAFYLSSSLSGSAAVTSQWVIHTGNKPFATVIAKTAESLEKQICNENH